MYLTAQRVISPGGEDGINGFLYEHGEPWDIPPEPADGAVGELVHTLITLPPGGNKVMSYIDIVAMDGTPYDRIHARLIPWIVERCRGEVPMPWAGACEDMRFGFHMARPYAIAWRTEASRLITACRMTLAEFRPRQPPPQ